MHAHHLVVLNKKATGTASEKSWTTILLLRARHHHDPTFGQHVVEVRKHIIHVSHLFPTSFTFFFLNIFAEPVNNTSEYATVNRVQWSIGGCVYELFRKREMRNLETESM